MQIIHASGKRSLTTSTLSFMRSAAALLSLLFLAPCTAADLPEPPAADVILSSVSASDTHSCGISDQGRLYCWGDGSGGQLGLVEKVAPEREGAYIRGTNFKAYVTSSFKRYLSSINGDADSSPFPQYVPVKESAPVAVDDATDWKQVSTGIDYTCAVKTIGQLYCWGTGDYGELGLDGIYSHFTPAIVDPDTEWAQVDAGGAHTCAVSTGGELYCWGVGHNGRPGNLRDMSRQSVPTRFGDEADWVQVSAGSIYTCAIKTTGRLQCWGYREAGDLEPGIDSRFHDPAPEGDDWRQVSVGVLHICAVKTNGGLYCWGRGDEGRLGQGDNKNHKTPAQVGTDRDWAKVSAGATHTCAINTGTQLYCWGNSGKSQLGLGDHSIERLPKLVGAGWKEVSAGIWHTCAVKTSGQLNCWGSIVIARLRIGVNDPRLHP
ncbi:MAG: hypothetical protein K8963_11285, partial [Proteobacteria bacterium]|nr:hypothetical protein [Pseudomonadota bacterium]